LVTPFSLVAIPLKAGLQPTPRQPYLCDTAVDHEGVGAGLGGNSQSRSDHSVRTRVHSPRGSKPASIKISTKTGGLATGMSHCLKLFDAIRDYRGSMGLQVYPFPAPSAIGTCRNRSPRVWLGCSLPLNSMQNNRGARG